MPNNTLWQRIQRWFQPRSVLAYRKVVAREPGEQGELVTLECGHRMYLIHVRRLWMPCEICAEAEQNQPREGESQ